MKVPPSLYFPDTADSVILRMRSGVMPPPFIRRMRLINLISAVVLRKIEPALLLPFDVEDLHHVLDRLISQDAVIDQLDSQELAAALYSGNLEELWKLDKKVPLLEKGFATGWIQKFFLEPFDPLCVMLAMRSKLLLDAVDEMGHSYNLIRSIGYGWIDWGDIPGETPGDPGGYYPPEINNPIIVPPASGGIPPGEPGSGSPSPDSPGFYPPGSEPIEQPFYSENGAPGAPGGVPGGAPGGGGAQMGATGGSMASPSGLLDQGLWTGPIGSAGGFGGGIDCRKDKDDPALFVHIGYDTLEMKVDEIQSLTIEGRHSSCEAYHYTWDITQGQGTLDTSEPYGAVYTAPAGGPTCESPTVINLYCDGELMDTIEIVINACPEAAAIECDTSQINIDNTVRLQATTLAPGCGAPAWAWEVIAGYDGLDQHTGEDVVFTAPAPGEDWEKTTTITLSCGGAVLDTITITFIVIPAWAENVLIFTMEQAAWPGHEPTHWGFYGFYATAALANTASLAKLAEERALHGSEYEANAQEASGTEGGISWGLVNYAGFSKTWAGLGWWQNYYFFYPKIGVDLKYEVTAI